MNRTEPIRDRKKIIEIEAYLKQTRPRDYLLFVLGIRVALRIGDLLSLTVGDVVDEAGIKNSLHWVEKTTGKRKTIKLNKKAREAIAWFIERTNTTDPTLPLFESQKGGALSRYQGTRLVKKWCNHVAMTGSYSGDSLRKTWAFQVWKNGGSVSLIREALGHPTEEATLRYIGIANFDVTDLYDLFDNE